MEDAEKMLPEMRRRLNAEAEETEAEIDATERAVEQLKREPCPLEDVVEKLSRHLQEIASRGAERVRQLRDHGDLSEVNIESHFAGAVVEVIIFVLAKEINALVLERLREIWPTNGRSAEDRNQKLKQFTEKLTNLREFKGQVDRQRLSAGVRSQVLVSR
jgi:DNA repair exonuclease SbcCD ATPase subunit